MLFGHKDFSKWHFLSLWLKHSSAQTHMQPSRPRKEAKEAVTKHEGKGGHDKERNRCIDGNFGVYAVG